MLAACGKDQPQKPPPPAMKVGAYKVETGDIQRALDISGTLTFIANTTLSAEVSAQVKSIEVGDGEAVKEGQLLLVFDETKIRESANQAAANLQKDEATLAFNRSEWEKNLELLKSRAVSQTQYDQKLSIYHNSLAQVEADKAVMAKAMEDLKKTKVLSPITGLLSIRFIEKGDWISEGGKLFQLSDYSRIYLESFVSDLDVGKLNVKRIISEGIDGEVRVDSYPGKLFKGKLSYIQPVANQSRLFQIRIYLENSEMSLLQGMFARGRIIVETIPSVVRVPLNALLDQVRDDEINNVYVMGQNSLAELRRIKVGATDANFAEVTGGLAPGEVVITQGKEVVSSGQLLQIVNSTNAEEKQSISNSPDPKPRVPDSKDKTAARSDSLSVTK